jgi:hypothetical protein
MNMPQIYNPNGLPLICVRYDGAQLEHAHADHPSYRYPVLVRYIGTITPHHYDDFKLLAHRDATSPQEVIDFFNEVHALIFEDGYVAVTLFECRYHMWSLKDGRSLRGDCLQLDVPLKITQSSSSL